MTSADGPVRTLILLRHGKADYPGGTRDYDRPLADRGELEAAAAGRWLRRQQPPIDAALCSASLRTRETLAATGIVAPARYADEIYEASPDEVLTEIRRTSADVATLLVVGHSPGMPALAARLTGRTADPEAAAQLSSRFPTSAMAVLQLPAGSGWGVLGPGDATLIAFHVARGADRD
ncbi:MAG: histidine phosphatase family protein [Nakamurella sp.]